MNIKDGFYSQNDEQLFINDKLGDKGKYLEVGAYDAFTFSNTRKLYERGWSGVLVEPSLTCFASLTEVYKDEPRIQLVNSAIMPKAGTVKFFDSKGDAISTTDLGHRDKWRDNAGVDYDEIEVDAMTWAGLLDKYGTDFDFLNLDTESTNWQLLSTFPFERCKPSMICVEYDDKLREMTELLSQQGYKTLHTTGENLIVWRG